MRAAAVILAAGAGTRLGGQAKAALRLADGRTFLQAVVVAARAAQADPVVVVVAAPHEATVRAAATAGECGAVVIVVNDEPARGMASSFAVGLAALPADVDVALLWPVDHPLPRLATVQAVLAAATRAAIVIPCHGGRGGHPAAIGADRFAACVAAVSRDGGVRAVIADEPRQVIRLTVDDPGVVVDVDTPADYAKIT